MSLKRAWARFLGWMRPDRALDAILREEIGTHIQMDVEENVERGMSPEEARRAAMVKFGNAMRIHEESRAMWSLPTIDSIVADVRFGWRVLWKSPGWAVVAILTLGIGIGANTAVFSVINALVLKSLPYPEAERLVYIWGKEGTRVPKSTVSYPDFLEWKAQTKTFSDIGAWYGAKLTIAGKGEPRYVSGQRTSASFFRALGVAPQLGRVYTDDEERYGNHRVIVLSDELWRSAFGADPNIIGRTVQVSGTPHEVIGVMPHRFYSLQPDAKAWVPLAFPPTVTPTRGSAFLTVIGRVKDGYTRSQAQAEIVAIAAQLAKQYPENRNMTAFLVPMQTQVTSKMRPVLWGICGAVAVVLLIGCANLANLLLARSATRRREIAIRASIGATRSRIVAQLVIESVLIAVLGASAGVLLAFGLIRGFSTFAFDYLPPIRDFTIDWATLAFVAVIAMIAAAMFGLIPAVTAAGANPQEVLKQDSGGTTVRQSGLKKALVIAEVALSVVLLSSAGLLIASVREMLRVDLGFEPKGAVAARIVLPYTSYPKDQDSAVFFSRLLEALRANPQVEAAGATITLPLGDGDQYWTMLIRVGQEPTDPGKIPAIVWFQATPDFVKAMKMPLRAGRAFTDEDDSKHPLVVMVNETLARKYFAGEDPIGKQIRFGTSPNDRPMTIIGVVASAPLDAINDDVPAAAYTPHVQGYNGISSDMTVVVRSHNNAAAMDLIRTELHKADPNLAIASMMSLEDAVAGAVRTPRLVGELIAAFAGTAVLLAGIGLFGVLSFAAVQRQREIGIRMALGADRRSVMQMIMNESAVLVACGYVIGVIGAIACATAIRSLLFRVKPTDPMSLIVGALGVALVAAFATALPARRAMNVDPVTALRQD